MKSRYESLMEEREFRKLLAIESLAAEAAELIARLMAEREVSRAELARRLGKSRPWVTQLLSGKSNLTLKTLAEAGFALGTEVRVDARKGGAGKGSATGVRGVKCSGSGTRIRARRGGRRGGAVEALQSRPSQ